MTTPNSVRPLYKATQTLWYIVGLIEAILGLRFVLRLIGANANAGFVDFIYSISRPLMAPFVNIVKNLSVSGSVFDWNNIIAMAVYWLLGWAIVRLFFISRPVSETEADYEIRRENNKL